MKNKLLIVDDEPANLRMLERLFRDQYEVVTACSGPEGLDLLSRFDVAVIISDQRMPEMKGIDFLKRAAVIRPQTVRIILTGYTDVSDLVEAINSGVIYKYITKPWINTDLKQNVRCAIEHFETLRQQHLLAHANERLERRLLGTVHGLVKVMREMIAIKRPDLSDHCRRTANYAALIGERMNLDPVDLESLIFASLLHEFPHLRQPLEIDLNVPTLPKEEFLQVRNRYESELNIISGVPDLQEVITIIRYQHERYDGQGFFDRLEGESIPLGSRILAAANAFDEIQSGRMPELYCTDEEALEWLRDSEGAELDPQIVQICLEIEHLQARESPALRTPVNVVNKVGAGL